MAWNAMRRKCATLFCYAALAAFATLASGIPTVPSPFALQPNGSIPIYSPTGAAPLAAVTIATSTGTVSVRVANGTGTQVGLGLVPAGKAGVFEGPFTGGSLLNPGPLAATGTYAVRAPVDGTDTDRLLGNGAVTLPTSSPPSSFRSYGSYNAVGVAVDRIRLLAVDASANGGGVTVSNESVSSPPPEPVSYAIDGGDWGFCSRKVSKFVLAGSGLVPFAVYDPIAGCDPITGTAKAQAVGDTDSISVDGSRALEITLVNNGVGTVTVTYAIAGGQSTPMVLAPGDSTGALTGAFTQFEWTYEAIGCTVSLSIRGH